MNLQLLVQNDDGHLMEKDREHCAVARQNLSSSYGIRLLHPKEIT
jgi:hypothetical protein